MPPTRTAPTALGVADLAAADDRVVRRRPTVATSAPIPRSPLDHTLGEGMAGDDVERLQQRLTELAFDVGPVDGYYGAAHAAGGLGLREAGAWACRGREATGQVTPEMWSQMQDPIQVAPRRSRRARPITSRSTCPSR